MPYESEVVKTGSAPSTAAAAWKTIADKVLSCSSAEYAGSLGTFDSGAGCLDAVQNQSTHKVNYAVWRGDSNNGCFVCAITDRGEPSTWAFSDAPGTESFIGPDLPPTAKLFAMPYLVHSDNSRGLLLVSKSAFPMKVSLRGEGLTSTVAKVLDGTLDGLVLDSEPGFVPPVARVVNSTGVLALGPYGIAIVQAGSAYSA